MVIGRIRRTKDPVNENALIFEADLQEYPTLETTLSKNGASLSDNRIRFILIIPLPIKAMRQI